MVVSVSVMRRKVIQHGMNWHATRTKIPKLVLDVESVDVVFVNVTKNHLMNGSMVSFVNVTISLVIGLKGKSALDLIMVPVTVVSANVTMIGLALLVNVEILMILAWIPKPEKSALDEVNVTVANVDALNHLKDTSLVCFISFQLFICSLFLVP